MPQPWVLDAIRRIEDWILDVKQPPYPFPIDEALAARGAPLYKQYCASCHGTSGRGDGAMRQYLRIPPADLPPIAAGNNGVFPA